MKAKRGRPSKFSDAERKAHAEEAGRIGDKPVAEKIGMHWGTIAKWRKDFDIPGVQVGINKGRRKDIATADEKRSLAEAMQSRKDEIMALVDRALAGEELTRTEMWAVTTILDRGWGKPRQSTEQDIKVSGDDDGVLTVLRPVFPDDPDDEGGEDDEEPSIKLA